MTPRLPLFAFGTLRCGESNHHYLAGRFDRVRKGALPGFARVAPLMIARQDGSVVVGELFDLTAATYLETLAGCDELEGIPTGELIGEEYRRIAVHVTVESETVIAWVYVRPDAEPDSDLVQWLASEV